jgi:hypothetical protein
MANGSLNVPPCGFSGDIGDMGECAEDAASEGRRVSAVRTGRSDLAGLPGLADSGTSLILDLAGRMGPAEGGGIELALSTGLLLLELYESYSGADGRVG